MVTQGWALVRRRAATAPACAPAIELRSVQARPLEKAIAVAGGDADLERAAVAINRQRHFHAGSAQRPNFAKEAGEILHLVAGDCQHDVPGAQIGPPGRAALRSRRGAATVPRLSAWDSGRSPRQSSPTSW